MNGINCRAYALSQAGLECNKKAVSSEEAQSLLEKHAVEVQTSREGNLVVFISSFHENRYIWHMGIVEKNKKYMTHKSLAQPIKEHELIDGPYTRVLGQKPIIEYWCVQL